MQKVYLLLRSNKQSGPYTKDELLDLNLKSFDLVWVEGKSFGWSYPSEIESLKTFVEAPAAEKLQTLPIPQKAQASIKNSSPALSQKIFVSMPVNATNVSSSRSTSLDNTIFQKTQEVKQKETHLNSEEPKYNHQELERKAELLRQRAMAYAPSQHITKQEEVAEIKYAKSLEEVEENYTSWMYKKRSKKNITISNESLISVLTIIVVVTGGWFIGSNLFKGETKNADQVVHVQNAEKEEIIPEVSAILVDENVSIEIADDIQGEKSSLASKSKLEKINLLSNSLNEIDDTIVASAPIEDVKTHEPIKTPQIVIIDEPVAEAELPKKKTLGESVSEVFRKLIKNDEAETKTEPSNSERKSSRRGEIINDETDISDQIEIKMNNNSENWMMGVIGLKLTLHNRSPYPLKWAEIEVLYYNDQNKLLDKKRISFSNVASKKSQTISAPDHRLADHAEVKIISAKGIQDAFAKN